MVSVFNKLTPKNDIEIDESQFNAMNFILSAKDIKNVAISGNYGSGKSSFIETYKTKNKDFNPIHISLTHFSREGKTNIADEQVNVLEGKIINQLLHRINPEDVPLTIFISKQNPANKTIRLWTVELIIVITAFLFLINYSNIAITLVSAFPWLPKIGALVRLSGYLAIFCVSGNIIYQLVKLQFHQKLFRNISLKGGVFSGQIEVFQNPEVSYFDKYLDDVLYLFENCQSNVVIFEDIDRFETNLIFEKLREINTLVNSKKKDGEKLIFIYLIKDDMFISQERTKFFDFIIPIIPVIISSNAGERFTKILNEMYLDVELDKKFLQKISIYIDDMRLAYNICNEFGIYRSVLSDREDPNKLQLDDERLFSMVVYKNIFPKDFSCLQMDSGLVYKVIHEANNLRQPKIKALRQEVSELENRIVDAEQEFAKSKLELYSIFLKIPEGRGALRVNGKLESEFSSRLDFIKELLNEEVRIESIESSYYPNVRVEKFENIFQIEDKEFQNRIKKLDDKENIRYLNENLKTLRNELNKVLSMKISHLLERSDFDEICSQDEFKYLQNDKKLSMIMFLVKNGYIDEGYSDYITYFYPNSLKKEDHEFLIAVQGEKILDEDYTLVEVSEVYDRLDDSYFEHDSILNFDLLKYTLTEGTSLERIPKYLSVERYNFLNRFLQNSSIGTDHHVALIIELMRHNQETLKRIFVSDNIVGKDKVYISNLLLSSVDLRIYDFISDFKEVLISFIEDNWKAIQDGLNSISEPTKENNSQIQDNLLFLGVKIIDFTFDKEHQSISSYVYVHNLYAINMRNIVGLLGYLGNAVSEEMVKHRPISIPKQFEELKIYIQENIEEYLEQAISFSEGQINDEQDDIYDILNNGSIAQEIRIAYMKCLSDETLMIEELKTMEMVEASLTLNKAICDTQNIMDAFYEYDDLVNPLLEFINSKDKINFEKTVFDRYPEERQRLFFRKTALCNDLNNEHYESILSVIRWRFGTFPEEEIHEDKVNILIIAGAISKEFNTDTLEVLRKRYPEQVIAYILKYLDGYIQNLDDSNVYDEEEIIQVLDKNISDTKAISIAEQFEGTISIQDKAFSPSLQAYILENLFDSEDLEYIVINYSAFNQEIQNVIFNKTKSFIEEIVSEELTLDKKLLSRIISVETIDITSRQVLLSRQLSDFSQQELNEKLQIVNLLESYDTLMSIISRGGNPKLEINEINKNILEFLKNNDKLSSYREEGEHYRVYSKKQKIKA
ncbi:DNA-binding protein [Streptococcus parasuis]|uniref:YobI family P-loop NTPase n=1 Tax=Streptococcus parasuis TaxID=1501662 RepID=UPI0028AA5F7F|nr:DNA-binding protein [Streptococcus parasuis]